MSRPEKLPSWCDDDSASKIIEMSEVKKAEGWIDQERMPFQFLNWLFRHFVRWFTHIDESVNQFDPHPADTPNMTVVITAGRLHAGGLVVKSQQATPILVAPVSNPRIDRIAIDTSSGDLIVISGTEAASPVAPGYGINHYPICQFQLETSTTEITSSMIIDERVLISGEANVITNEGDLSGLSELEILIPSGTKRIDLGYYDARVSSTSANIAVQIGTGVQYYTDVKLRSVEIKAIDQVATLNAAFIGFNVQDGFFIDNTSQENFGNVSLWKGSNNRWYCRSIAHADNFANSIVVMNGAVELSEELTKVKLLVTTGTFSQGILDCQYSR